MNKPVEDAEMVRLPSYYVQQVIKQVQHMSGKGHLLLESIGFDESVLEQTDVFFTWSEFCHVAMKAKKLTNDNLGLIVGKHLLINTHGLLGYIAMNCGSIRQFVDTFTKFLPLRTNLVSIDNRTEDNYLLMRLTPNPLLKNVEQLIVDSIMVAIKNMFDYIMMGQESSAKVAFPYMKGKTSLFAEEILDCEVLYNQPYLGFIFPLEEVDRPLLAADKDGFEHATIMCQQELEKLDINTPLNKKIEHLLLNRKVDFPNITQVAHAFNISERTLYRSLEKEGVRFNEITQKVKCQKANKYFNSGLKTQEVAFLLGYKYVGNFRRACDRWKKDYPEAFGITP